MAFAMQTLDPPLDLAFASDGELYNENKSVQCTVLCLNPITVKGYRECFSDVPMVSFDAVES